MDTKITETGFSITNDKGVDLVCADVVKNEINFTLDFYKLDTIVKIEVVKHLRALVAGYNWDHPTDKQLKKANEWFSTAIWTFIPATFEGYFNRK